VTDPTPETRHVAPIPRIALRPREAAQALGVSERTLWTWTQAGDVPHVRRGATVLYPVEALRDWLERKAKREGVGQ